MTKEQIFELLREEIEEITWKSQEGLTADTTLKELGFDSLDNIELIMRAEKKTGLSIPDEDVERVSSVGEMVDYLFARMKYGVESVVPKKEIVSEVKWQTGEPKEEGVYLVQIKNGIRTDCLFKWDDIVNGRLVKKYSWRIYKSCDVIAWCNLRDIKPYKE